MSYVVRYFVVCLLSSRLDRCTQTQAHRHTLAYIILRCAYFMSTKIVSCLPIFVYFLWLLSSAPSTPPRRFHCPYSPTSAPTPTRQTRLNTPNQETTDHSPSPLTRLNVPRLAQKSNLLFYIIFSVDLFFSLSPFLLSLSLFFCYYSPQFLSQLLILACISCHLGKSRQQYHKRL